MASTDVSAERRETILLTGASDYIGGGSYAGSKSAVSERDASPADRGYARTLPAVLAPRALGQRPPGEPALEQLRNRREVDPIAHPTPSEPICRYGGSPITLLPVLDRCDRLVSAAETVALASVSHGAAPRT